MTHILKINNYRNILGLKAVCRGFLSGLKNVKYQGLSGRTEAVKPLLIMISGLLTPQRKYISKIQI